MKSVYEIKRSLEETFDIPFLVELHPGPEPGYLIRPDKPGKVFFDITIEFRNHVRMIMNFVPQKYGAPFVRNMGEKPLESRLRFSGFSNCLQHEGFQIDFQLNDRRLNSTKPEEWPDCIWDKVLLRATKAPFELNEELDYGDLALKYGQLMLGMVLSLADIVPLEDSSTGYKEGGEQLTLSKKYERNRLNRELCLLNKGYKCSICGFDFQDFYGAMGQHFIHVHHIVPVSQIGPDYIINPVKDLIPVCPNCHAMLHRKNPPYLPEEIKAVVEKELAKKNEKKTIE